MNALVVKSSHGQYDDYTEVTDSVWVREEPFNWPFLRAEFQRLCEGVRKENQGKQKNLIPTISLEQFLLANDFFPVDFEEQLD
jgi:hypothetical protein